MDAIFSHIRHISVVKLIISVVFVLVVESIIVILLFGSQMLSQQDALNLFVALHSHNLNHVSVDLYRFNSKKEVIVNGDFEYMPASLAKVPVMLAYYKLAESQPDILQQKVLYIDGATRDYTQNIPPEKKLVGGTMYAVNNLIAQMIVYSDNNALFALCNNINFDNIKHVFIDFGIDTTNIEDPNYTITVTDYAKFFKALYQGTYLSKELSHKALRLLDSSEYKNGLVQGVPRNTTVAEKFGERIIEGRGIVQFHECGIVYPINHPYLLCVMTDGTNLPEQEKFVRNLSQYTYQLLSGKYVLPL